jgi:hypothetical protein
VRQWRTRNQRRPGRRCKAEEAEWEAKEAWKSEDEAAKKKHVNQDKTNQAKAKKDKADAEKTDTERAEKAKAAQEAFLEGIWAVEAEKKRAADEAACINAQILASHQVKLMMWCMKVQG